MRKETLHPHPLYLAGDVSLRAEGMPIPLHVLGETAELLPSRSPEPFAPLVILPLNEVKGKNFTAQDRLREEASNESLPGLLRLCLATAYSPGNNKQWNNALPIT